MARKKIFTRTTTIVIAGLVVFIVAYSLINFGNLSISDPFVTENFGFQATDLAFLSISPTTTSVGLLLPATTTCTSPQVLVFVNGVGICKTPPENLRLADFIKPTSGTTSFTYLCKLKLHTDVKLKDGGIIGLDSDFQEVSPAFPAITFSVATPSLKIIDYFETEPRLTCDAIIAKDGSRLSLKVTSQNLLFSADAYNAQGVRFLVKQNQIGLSSVDFVDAPPIYITNERPVGQKIKTTALEIENKLSGTTSFDARVRFLISGSLFVEVPELSKYTSTPFKTRLDIDQTKADNEMNLKILKGGTQAPTTTTPFLEITEVRPQIVETDGRVGSSELVQVFTKLNNWNQNEGTPTCTATENFSFFSSAQGSSVLRSSDGINSFFECRMFMPADSKIGKYEVRAKTQASNRPVAISSFTLALDSAGQTTTGGTQPCYDCQGKLVSTVSDAKQCPLFDCGISTVGGTGGAPICSDGQPASKIGTGAYTCQRSDGTDDTTPTLFPKFVECPAGVVADTTKSEICTDPFIVWLLSGFNVVFLIMGIIIFIIIISIIASAIKGRSSI